jgi:hypothetical protein
VARSTTATDPAARTQPPDGLNPDAIIRLGMGFWASKTLLSAVELGVFTLLSAGPLSAEEIAAKLSLHERSIRDFLDALVALDMLQRKDGCYTNTAATDLYLDRSKPSYVGGLLEMLNARLYGFWGSLTDALRTGQPQNEVKQGRDLFDDLYRDPGRLAAFARAMTGNSLGPAVALARRFPWANYKSFVDVGTAQGGVAVELVRRHPHLTGIGFDLSPIAPHFEAYVAENGFSDRLAFAPGDFFSDPLPRADAVIMRLILHDWGLERKRFLIARAFEALPSGGAFIVYEWMIDDERRANAMGLLMSLNMLIETREGFDFTGADCMSWMQDAGFRDLRVEPLSGFISMAVGIKP